MNRRCAAANSLTNALRAPAVDHFASRAEIRTRMHRLKVLEDETDQLEIDCEVPDLLMVRAFEVVA